MLARLDDLDLLAAIHPDLSWDEWVNEKVAGLYFAPAPPPEWRLSSRLGRQSLHRILGYALWFIRLAPDHARLVMERLKLATAVARDILQACKLWQELPALVNFFTAPSPPEANAAQAFGADPQNPISHPLPPSAIVTRLDDLSPLALYAAYLATPDPRAKELLYTYVIRWQSLRPSVTGDDLRARGIPPGPIYAQLLTSLRNAWLDGAVTNAAQEAELLEQLLLKSK
jgi:tRNA nucleotidyltransferase (CCA-adding enzyme)